MPLPSNLNTFVGASVLGCVVCVATIYVIEQFRQDRRRHVMAQDLARIDTELAVLRKQFDKLVSLQSEKIKKKQVKRKITNNVRAVSPTTTTTDDYASAVEIDSDELEFYDVSDEEPEEDDGLTIIKLNDILNEIDDNLDEGDANVIERCLNKLKDLCIEYPENPELLWRIGKAHYKLYEKSNNDDDKQNHIAKGIAACTVALDLQPVLADVHKWLAILIGSRSDFQPMKEKILDGHLFKKHVDAAIQLRPGDPSLHHMLGRFTLEVASLKWYERKIASAMFSEPPNSTYDQALEHFLKAEDLSSHEWKENKLCVAKCKIKMGEIEDAVGWLTDANSINDQGEDKKIDEEIKILLEKYSGNV